MTAPFPHNPLPGDEDYEEFDEFDPYEDEFDID